MIKMLKRKIFLISILTLLISNSLILTDVVGLEYRVGVNKNDELIWKCKVSNNLELNNLFGIGWDNTGIFNNISKGMKMRWKINNIELSETYIKLNFSMWTWNSRTIWGAKDNDSQIIYYSNPNDYSRELNFSNYLSLVPFWFPIPVGDYMGGLNLNDWYDVDNRVLPTINVEIEENAILPGFPSRDLKIIAIYNDQGILNSYKLYIKGNVVIIDIAYDFLPLYVIPTLIGLICVFVLGIIIFIIKKRKTKISPEKKMVNRV